MFNISVINHYTSTNTQNPRDVLENLPVNPSEMRDAYSGDDISGVGVTIRGSEVNGCVDRHGTSYDFVSRYFAPWLGIPEDPVTGFCCLFDFSFSQNLFLNYPRVVWCNYISRKASSQLIIQVGQFTYQKRRCDFGTELALLYNGKKGKILVMSPKVERINLVTRQTMQS